MQLERDVNLISRYAQVFQHFRFSSEGSACLVPSALGCGLFRPVFLARATRNTRQTRPAGHGEIACHGSPRSCLAHAAPAPGAHTCSARVPDWQTGRQMFLPAISLTCRPEVPAFDSPSWGFNWMSQAVGNLLRLQSFGTPRLCQSKEYAWNLPLH